VVGGKQRGKMDARDLGVTSEEVRHLLGNGLSSAIASSDEPASRSSATPALLWHEPAALRRLLRRRQNRKGHNVELPLSPW
jgi:hypothetical protein